MTPEIILSLIRDGYSPEIRSTISMLLEEHPEDPLCWLAMGLFQAYNRDYDWAAQSLEKFLQCLEAQFGSK